MREWERGRKIERKRGREGGGEVNTNTNLCGERGRGCEQSEG